MPMKSLERTQRSRRLRNRVAHRIANFALNHIATPDYCDGIDSLIRDGVTYRNFVAELRARRGGRQ